MTRWPLIVGGVVILMLLARKGKAAVMKHAGNCSGDRLMQFSEAVAIAEGFGVPDKLPTRNNNPGAIRSSSGPIAYYQTVEEGWEALYALLGRIVAGTSRYYKLDMTIYQMAAVYTGEAKFPEWAENVGSVLGVDPMTTTLGDYLCG